MNELGSVVARYVDEDDQREMSDEELLERAGDFANRLAANTNGRSCLPPHTP